jgi:hypothetical protein
MIDYFKDIQANRELLESIYNKFEKFGLLLVAKKQFGFQTINQCILFINSEIQEIRDDSKEAVTVAFLKRFYSSKAFSELKGKIPEEIRNKLNGFIDDGLVHYISIANSSFVTFNYYIWRKWLVRKITYLYKRLTGFFSGVPKPEIQLCDKCKMPIETDVAEVDNNNVIFAVDDTEEDTTPVVSQMEVFPGQVPESGSEPLPSASSPPRIVSAASKKDVAPSTPQATQEKM